VWDELSHAEAASVFGCSVNAIASRLKRARAQLRRALEPTADVRSTNSVPTEPTIKEAL
jgi:DNA-directed RNA polymerase specialized sigma24 family protein